MYNAISIYRRVLTVGTFKFSGKNTYTQLQS